MHTNTSDNLLSSLCIKYNMTCWAYQNCEKAEMAKTFNILKSYSFKCLKIANLIDKKKFFFEYDAYFFI